MPAEWGEFSFAIVTALRDLGPMTTDELIEETGCSRSNIRSILSRLKADERIHISGSAYSTPGQRNYPRPIWSHGKGTNKSVRAIPAATRAVGYRQSRKRRVASVFDLR